MLRKSDFVPPILMRILQAWRSHSEAKKVERFPDYASALARCSSDGYEDNDLVDVIAYKTAKYRDQLGSETPIEIPETFAYSLCPFLSLFNKSKLCVFDFGGGCGAHYFLVRSLIPSEIQIQWTILETERMVSRARADFESDELVFTLSWPEEKETSYDLLFSSGTVQFTPHSLEALSRCFRMNARYVFMNRFATHSGSGTVTCIHSSMLSSNGIGPMPSHMKDREVHYPYTVLSERDFRHVLDANHTMIARYPDQSGIFPIPGVDIQGFGFLAKRNENLTHDE